MSRAFFFFFFLKFCYGGVQMTADFVALSFEDLIIL